MLTLTRTLDTKPKPTPAQAAATHTASAPHRQKYGVEIGYFHGVRERSTTSSHFR